MPAAYFGRRNRVPAAKFDASQREAFEKHSTRCLDGAEFYRLHQERGNQWGPCFQGVSRVWQGCGEALSEVTVPLWYSGRAFRYFFHPAFSDSLGQILTATIPLENTEAAGRRHLSVPGSRKSACIGGRRADISTPTHNCAAMKPLPIILWSATSRYSISPETSITETLGARLCYLDSAQKHDVLESVEDWLYEPRWEIKEAAGRIEP